MAGPVYTCAVLLPFEHNLIGLTDSKLLSVRRRESLEPQIHSTARVSVAFATVEEIESLNILGATFLAMKRAVEALNCPEAMILVDGNQKIKGIAHDQLTLVKGDLRAEPIAAASICAKVARDRLMENYDLEYPHYAFSKHKGYGTKDHREALKKWGPSSIHRRSFSGVLT